MTEEFKRFIIEDVVKKKFNTNIMLVHTISS